MNPVSIMDIFAVIFFGLALCVLTTLNKKKIAGVSKVFLSIAFFVYLLVQISNVLEHAEITDAFDKYEDYFELLFVPFILAFFFNDFNWIKSLKLLKAEQQIRQSEQRFRDLTENSSDFIWEIDENDKYTYVSPIITPLLGYKPDEIIGKTPFYMMSKKEEKRVQSGFQKIKAARKEFASLENINKWKDKKLLKTIETSGVPIFDKKGEFRGYRGISRDITERKKVEKEKGKLIKRLKKALDEIKALQGILPICSYCKKIRNDEGSWQQMESYISAHSEADFSHGICPNCYKEQFPKEYEEIIKDSNNKSTT